MKILVVAPLNARTKGLFVQLRQVKATLLTSDSCREAVRIVDADNYIDLIVVWHDPGDTCGRRVLYSIRSDAACAPLPIVIVGNQFDLDSIQEFNKLGVTDIMMFPVEADVFASKVSAAVESGRRTILVVDDDSAIRELLQQFLTFHRYHTLTAGDGNEALDILAKESVQAVVTDLSMPGMSGLELLGKVKAQYPDTAVILITGNSRQHTPDQLVAMGADGYFSKPFHNKELALTLKTALARYGTRRNRDGSITTR